MRAVDLPDNQRIEAVDAVLQGAKGPEAEKKIDAFLDKLYAGTKLGSPEERLRMFELSREDLLKQGDPFVDFAVQLGKEAKVLEEKDKAMQGALQRLSSALSWRRSCSGRAAISIPTRTARCASPTGR